MYARVSSPSAGGALCIIGTAGDRILNYTSASNDDTCVLTTIEYQISLSASTNRNIQPTISTATIITSDHDESRTYFLKGGML